MGGIVLFLKKSFKNVFLLFKVLFFEHRIPWRIKEKYYRIKFPWIIYGMNVGAINYLLFRTLNKLLLKFKSIPSCANETITVVIAIKDRDPLPLKNSFMSIRSQNYPQDLIKIILIDYDSNRELSPELEKLCSEYNVQYIRLNNHPVWSRSHSLNIGIKNTKTKYILTSDIDVIFGKNYIEEAVKELKRNPYQIILSRCLMLPKVPDRLDFELFRKISKLKQKVVSKGISLGLTHIYQKVNGYDEFFKEGGFEDFDLMKRFIKLGLSLNDMSSKISYFHQFHPEKKQIGNYKEKIEQNRKYFLRHNSIIRNKNGWGNIN